MRNLSFSSPNARTRSIFGAALALALASSLGACSASDVVFLASGSDAPLADGESPDGGAPSWNVQDASDDATTRPAFDGGANDAGSPLCTVDGAVPVLSLGDGGCVGDLAARAFRFALCVCDDVVSNAGFASVNSSAQGSDAGASASVGVNGNFISTLPATIGGSLWTRQAIRSDVSLAVEGELHCATNLTQSGSANVRSDAWVGGTVDVDSLQVAGTLTQPAGALNHATITAAHHVNASVSFAAPCDCEPSQLIPVPALVQSLETANDNAAVGFSSQAFSSISSQTSLDLPCGKLHATAVQTSSPLTLRVGAQTVLAVSGDLDLGADFTIELTSPGASLDLLVGGTIRSNSAVRIGSAGRASAVRIYVGSATSLDMSAAWELHGNLYAPTAVLNTSGGAVFDGAVFVKSLAASAPLSFGYDKRVLEVPDNCAPPGGCHDCRDCRGQACVGGQCGACTDSSQCCAPLVCLAGACVPEAPPR